MAAAFLEDGACVVTIPACADHNTGWIVLFVGFTQSALSSPVSQLSSREKQVERALSSSLSSVKLSSASSSFASLLVIVDESRPLVGTGFVRSSLFCAPMKKVKD